MPIDLDVVELAFREIAERRITGAEIVEGKAYAERDKLVEHGNRAGALAHEDAFGDFEFEAVRRQAAVRQSGNDRRNKARTGQLFGRHIDRDAHGFGPAFGFGTGGAQYPLADGADQPRVFGDGHKAGRRHMAEFGTVPTQKCLEPFDDAAFGTDHGLIMHKKLVVLERLAQRDFEHATFLGMLVKLRLVGVVRPATLIFRTIEGQIGRADERFNRTPIARANGSAD